MKIPHWPLYLGPDLNPQHSIERMFLILREFGDPHLKLKNIIHVTGTKGKGSTCVYLNAILTKLNYKVGLYISPHIYEANERIVFNEQNISDEDLYSLTEQIRLVCENLKIDKISSFEALTITAILYFVSKNADFNIIEVGMGGLLDATNVFEKNPAIAVILNPIHFDHKIFLGNTIESIAAHKLGILNNKVKNIIISSQADYVKGIIKHYIKIINDLNTKNEEPQINSYFYDEDFSGLKIEILDEIKNETEEFEKQNIEKNFFIFNSNFVEENFIIQKPSLLGEYQMINLSTAIQVIFAIGKSLNFQEKLTTDLFSNLKIKHIARMEQIVYKKLLNMFHEKSLIYMDGAHNQISAYTLNREIEEIKKKNNFQKVYLIMARSKNSSDEMIKVFNNNIIDEIICTRANLESRPEAPEIIMQMAENYNFKTSCYENIKMAIEKIQQEEDKKEPILIVFTGSLYLMRDIKYFFEN